MNILKDELKPLCNMQNHIHETTSPPALKQGEHEAGRRENRKDGLVSTALNKVSGKLQPDLALLQTVFIGET